MKREDTVEKTLRRHLGLFGAPANQLAASRERIRERLVAARAATPLADDAPARALWRPLLATAAAAVVVAAAIGTAIMWPRGPERYTASDAGDQITLADGSQVEMRAHSELTVDRADDGIRIHLTKGGIIVNAAKQRAGHLYVQTRDMTVSVVGTVFLVNAADDGSRVAVIEGEVRVRDKTTDTKLRPGEHVSTSPTMATRPLNEEIAWSRHADAHLAILEAFTRGMTATAGPLRPLNNAAGPVQAAPVQSGSAAATREFEEASLRSCDPDNLPPTPPGARGGGANSFQMTPGRLHALCLTLATLIRTAYDFTPGGLDFLNEGRGRGRGMEFNSVYGLGVEDGLRVRGGPDWVRSERYTVDAVADSAADAAMLRGPMLRALLEKRFQLKAHIETEQVPAFVLTVAPGGLKITPAASGACEMPVGKPGAPLLNGVPMNLATPPRSFVEVRRGEKPTCGQWGGRNGPNLVWLGGEATFDGLAQQLSARLGGIRVSDKTGITDKFNWILEFVVDENTPGPFGARELAPDPSAVPPAQTIFVALEEQLGLRLEPARAPREFIVIDSVERPSPN